MHLYMTRADLWLKTCEDMNLTGCLRGGYVIATRVVPVRGPLPAGNGAVRPGYGPVCFGAGVAQLVELLTCNEVVGGSSPLASSISPN